MAFRPVFIAVVVAFALIVSAFLINRARPRVETDQPSATLVRASGKCAECHTRQQYAVVDPTRPAEPQLARLEWLFALGVLNHSQTEQLKTRLLGKFYGSDNVPGNEFGLAPSVN